MLNSIPLVPACPLRGAAQHFFLDAFKSRYSGKNTLKILQWFPNANTTGILIQHEFANCSFVITTSFLDYSDGLPNLTSRFEVAQIDHSVTQVTEINRRF